MNAELTKHYQDPSMQHISECLEKRKRLRVHLQTRRRFIFLDFFLKDKGLVQEAFRFPPPFFKRLTPALCSSDLFIREAFGQVLARRQQARAKQWVSKFAFIIGHLNVGTPSADLSLPWPREILPAREDARNKV